MNILLFTHKNDIDGMGNVILAQLAFQNVTYELCGTFDLTKAVEGYFENGTIYEYDKIYVTDLCLQDPVLSKVAQDVNLVGKVQVFDHHKTFAKEPYTSHPFITVQLSDEAGLCCGTSLFYQHLVKEGYLAAADLAIKEFVELTRQHDTWEWRNIYHNEKSRDLSILFDILGHEGYIDIMTRRLREQAMTRFDFTESEKEFIEIRKQQIAKKCEEYAEKIIYKEVLGLKAGIVFITYEYRNELGEYFRQNKFDMDFVMMIAFDPGVVTYRSVNPEVSVRIVAEYFGGKGHDKAGTNSITDGVRMKLIDLLTNK